MSSVIKTPRGRAIVAAGLLPEDTHVENADGTVSTLIGYRSRYGATPARIDVYGRLLRFGGNGWYVVAT